MNILITGSKGMVGTALVNNLKAIRDGKNCTRPELVVHEIYEYDVDSTKEQLESYCQNADFVFHLAGINRSDDEGAFMMNNYGFTAMLLDLMKKYENQAPIMFASSIQASMIVRFQDSLYAKSKKEAEDLLFDYEKETKAKVFVYRFPNIMGQSKPYYNSAISTFCYGIANEKEYTVDDQSTKIELLYIDDLLEGMYDLLEGKEIHCEYEGVEAKEVAEGKYCFIPKTHTTTLGNVVDLLLQFKEQPASLLMPKMPEGSFEKNLYSLYLTYLPVEKMKYAMKMNIDERGSFTELVHTTDCGMVSVNVIKPGVIKGQHWHNSKWEIFIVVSGHGLIRERNINTGEIVEFEVSGEKIEGVYMIPGWTHNIINLSETENLVTVMTCNEVFHIDHPDTFHEPV